MAWFPVAVFCQRQGVKVHLVNSQQVADLRRFYRKHAKSDRIDSRVLATLPIVSPEKLHPLQLIGASQLACQRGCKELDRLMDMNIAIQNRLRAIDRFAWPGLEHVLPDNVAPIMRWFREHWYEPNWINRWLAERNNYRNNIEEERQRGRRGSQRSDGVCWS